MTRLVSMQANVYPRFLDEAVTGYARDNVVAGRWPVPRNPVTGQFPAAYPTSGRGRVILYWGPSHDAHLLVPVIPA